MAAVLLVWRRDPISGRLSQAELPEGSIARDLLPAGEQGAFGGDCYVTCNGRQVSRDEALQSGLTYSVEPRLLGGKGGFGSMLRALGAQIEKTTNREACRDLSGRRLRDVNHEKAMAEWIKKQADREAEKEQRRLERLKRKLAEPKHYFTDPEYHNQCSDMSERLEESVIKGLQATSSAVVSPESSDCRKRKIESKSGKGKSSKKFLWTGLEGLEVSSGSDSSSDSDCDSPGTSSSCHSAEQRRHSSDSDSDRPEPCSSHIAVSHEPDQNPERGDGERPSIGDTGHETVMEVSKQPDQESESPGTSSSSSCHSTEQRRHSSDSNFDRPEPCSSPIAVSHQPDQNPEPGDGERPSIEDTGHETVTEVSKQPDQNPEPGDGERPSIEDTSHETVTEVSKTEHLEVAECEKPADVAEPPKTDSGPFDLLSFSSAAELEALGLEKLKTELMALGLKCGGTLQERATRLFSVRGLSREQMDPALFAKPAKGRKK